VKYLAIQGAVGIRHKLFFGRDSHKSCDNARALTKNVVSKLLERLLCGYRFAQNCRLAQKWQCLLNPYME